MAAGTTQITVKDGGGSNRSLNQWSSDGTNAGNLSQMVHAEDGELVTIGAKADAAYAGSGSSSVVAALKGIYASLVAALPAGTNLIGKVGIDQTTPGTTNGVQVNAPLPAGQYLIGNVGGKSVSVTVTPTVTASQAYGINYVVGGKLTVSGAFSSTGTGILQGITVTCKQVESMGWTVFVFATDPSSSTFTDNQAAAINAADVSKARGPFSPVSSSALGTCTVATVSGIGLPIQAGATSFYAVLLSNAALTNNFTGTNDVSVTFHILPDA